jgi:hypothetical protein
MLDAAAFVPIDSSRGAAPRESGTAVPLLGKAALQHVLQRRSHLPKATLLGGERRELSVAGFQLRFSATLTADDKGVRWRFACTPVRRCSSGQGDYRPSLPPALGTRHSSPSQALEDGSARRLRGPLAGLRARPTGSVPRSFAAVQARENASGILARLEALSRLRHQPANGQTRFPPVTLGLCSRRFWSLR